MSSSALFQPPAHLQNLKWRTRIPNGGWKRGLITLNAKEFFLFSSFSSAWPRIQRWLTNPSICCWKKERNSHHYAEEQRLNLFALPWYWLPRWKQSLWGGGFHQLSFRLRVTSLFNDHWPHTEPQCNLTNLESPQKWAVKSVFNCLLQN